MPPFRPIPRIKSRAVLCALLFSHQLVHAEEPPTEQASETTDTTTLKADNPPSSEDSDSGDPPSSEDSDSGDPPPEDTPTPESGPQRQVEKTSETAEKTSETVATDRLVLPQLASAQNPPYTDEALRARIEGRVVLALTVDAGGVVTAARLIAGLGHGLDESALSAALTFRFAPALKEGKPLAVEILHEVLFTLPTEEPLVAPQDPSSTKSSLRPPIREAPPGTLPAAQGAQEVFVHGLGAGERLERSAEAVTVVDTEGAKRESADTGEVLARTRGVSVRRAGGLGSVSRLSLGGFDEDQIRFFLDGIPLEYAGYPFGIANVPLNLTERLEIYQGVLPARFGADALGGAVNLVTNRETSGTHGGVSYQAGSFDTTRISGAARHLDERTGLFAALEGFHDASQNDYLVDILVTDSTTGRQSPATVRRFHDAYQAEGASFEAGLMRRKWAQKLLMRGFFSQYQKELQHNIVMTVPYGDALYGGRTAGGTLRYEHSLGNGLHGEVVVGLTHSRTDFVDLANCIYDWFGQCVRERRTLGEVGEHPSDLTIWDDVAFARVHLKWLARYNHALRFTSAPTLFRRTGDERAQLDSEARDPLSAKRQMLTVVSGLEYEMDLLDDRLENVVFGKNYVQSQRTEEHTPGNLFVQRNVDSLTWGLGDALRYKLSDYAAIKASYEWASRLPRPEEIFGNGVLVVENLDLEPERSHNLNLGALLYDLTTSVGAIDGSVNGFLREAEELIVLLGNDRSFSYQNVYAARSLGVESSFTWTSKGAYVAISGNATYQDFRNRARNGPFSNFRGDRIPNQPYLFGGGSLRLTKHALAAPTDEISLTFYTRYVHEFFRRWESAGDETTKQTVDTQLFHTIALAYLIQKSPLDLSFSSEVSNVTNAKTYDFVGVQKPGRAFSFKTTLQF